MATLILVITLHFILARIATLPWFVPNLTIAALILAVLRKPSLWFLFSYVAAAYAAIWAVRSPLTIFVSYVAIGYCTQLLTRQLDANRMDLQCFIVGVSALIAAFVGLWIDGTYSAALFALIGLHVIISSLSVPFLRYLFIR